MQMAIPCNRGPGRGLRRYTANGRRSRASNIRGRRAPCYRAAGGWESPASPVDPFLNHFWCPHSSPMWPFGEPKQVKTGSKWAKKSLVLALQAIRNRF